VTTAGPARIEVVALGAFRKGDRILVYEGRDGATRERFHRLVGGRIEAGERAADALAREVDEELGLEIEAPLLLGVLENLFTYEGRARHEIVFVFDARFRDLATYARQSLRGVEADGTAIDAGWRRLGDFDAHEWPLVPAGLLELLTARA
jgi:ADP-ribose pyrophosphatase YjhB (NUDIX family)